MDYNTSQNQKDRKANVGKCRDWLAIMMNCSKLFQIIYKHFRLKD